MRSDLRPLPISFFCLLVLVTLGGLEWGARNFYDPPTPMLDKAQAFRAQSHTKDQLLIFGTCLAEQIIDPELLQHEIGANLKVQNLATAAGTSQLMYYTLKNHIPHDIPVRGIVVPYGSLDLSKVMGPQESQTMEMVHLKDLSELIEIECQDDPNCETQLWARKISKMYRYRDYLANWFWLNIGGKAPPSATDTNPGDAPPPPQELRRGSDPQKDPMRLDKDGREILVFEDGRVMRGEKQTRAKSDFRYLIRFLELAKAREIPVFLLPLPTRNDYMQTPNQDNNRKYKESLQSVIDQHGGIHMTPESIDGLSADDFSDSDRPDEQHLKKRGRSLVTKALGKEIQAELKTP